MEEEAFLIDQDGNRISSEAVSSHIGLVYLLFQKDKELQRDFEKSGKRNPLDFLLTDKGYMSVGRMGTYKSFIYDSTLISEKQQRWKQYYYEEGYEIKDLAIEKRKLERGEL